jgi:hypothetical protein
VGRSVTSMRRYVVPDEINMLVGRLLQAWKRFKFDSLTFLEEKPENYELWRPQTHMLSTDHCTDIIKYL